MERKRAWRAAARARSQSVLNDPNRDNYLQNQGSRPIRPATSYEQPARARQRGFTLEFCFHAAAIPAVDYPAPLIKPEDQVSFNYTVSVLTDPVLGGVVAGTVQLQPEAVRITDGDRCSGSCTSGGRRSASSGTRTATSRSIFSIFLTDLPDLRYDYQQTTFEQ